VLSISLRFVEATLGVLMATLLFLAVITPRWRTVQRD